ncbi:MAG: helix-turn-helix domain-containing protein [Candidatus Magasanikiibacteriota bacterium]
MEKNNLEKLIDLGLQENEAKIYLALLELGKGNVTEISRRAGLNRTTGYDILERLGLHGMVNRARVGSKKIIYVAEPPSHLRQYLEDKKRAMERRMEELNDLLPDLQSLYKTDIKPVIKFAEGKSEMQKLYLNVLDAKSEVYSILNLKGYAEVFDELGAYQSKERHKKGIKEKVLAIKNDTALWWYNKTYKNKTAKDKKLTEYRWLEDAEKYSTAGEVNIFDDKVIGVLSKPSENVAFEIQSQTFADFLKLVFEMAWKNSEQK